ncbi:hypothetical protein BgAZ_203020 [Babesia gibsoni]|uniref:Protein YIPF n=1 Tax=Babesia gibsoni TaxID=33632 RepID=A0AAD8LR53_BABGI|nr:hypothetical protein BgAZ_203020 [Babesia gibsoni]
MDPFVRNRKTAGPHGHRNDESSAMGHQGPFSFASVGPMNLGGSAPPSSFTNQNVATKHPSFYNVSRQQSHDAFSSASINSNVSHNMSGRVPTLNIFGHSSASDSASSNRDIKDYLDGVAPQAPFNSHTSSVPSNHVTNMSTHDVNGPYFDGYNAAQVTSSYGVQSSPPSWQPQQYQNDALPQYMPSGSFGMNQMHRQPSHSLPSVGFFDPNSGFAQQLKQMGQMYMKQGPVEEDLIDPPLLEELGIDVDDIIRHIKCVLLFKNCRNGELQYSDFTGPILVLLLLALSLLVSCNLNFSLVYVIEVIGTWCMYLLFNLTSQDVYIDMAKTAIILGYSLLPICLTPLIWLFSRFAKPLAVILVYMCVAWSTSTSSRLLVQELNMGHRKYLVIYPSMLYYLFFAHVAMT